MRAPDWERLLLNHLSAGTRFEWGVSDCALDGANWVKACTGVDYAEDFRGRYKTPRGAVTALRRYGSGSLSATIDQMVPGVPIQQGARRGDLVGFPSPSRLFDCLIGICAGDAAGVFGVDGRRAFVPISNATRIWRVD